jgi:hypothetical protein
VRGCAAQAFGELGTLAREYVGELEALLQDPDTHVQDRSREALDRIASAPANGSLR